MDNHGIKMKGDFETDNIKSQDGVDAIEIENVTGKTTLKNETVMENGNPSAGALLRSSDSSGTLEYVRPNSQENLLYNSQFDVLHHWRYIPAVTAGPMYWWQPKAGGASWQNEKFHTDMWMYNDTATGPPGRRIAFASDQTDVPGGPKHYIEQECPTADGSGWLLQKLPIVPETAGRTMTFSCWYKTSRAPLLKTYLTEHLVFGVTRNFGSTTTSGSATSNDIESVDYHFLDGSTTWAHYTRTFTVPSLSGKTIYDEGELSLCIWMHGLATLTDFTFQIAQPKLEWGNVYTGMPTYDKSNDTHRCQQFFEYVPVLRSGVQWVSTNIIGSVTLKSNKQKNSRVSVTEVPFIYTPATISLTSITYNPITQAIQYAIDTNTPSYTGEYYYSGAIECDCTFNREFA